MPHLHKATRRPRAFLALLMLPVFIVSVSAQQASSGDKSSVSLSFTALDKNKQPVTTLRREDIRALEDGVPQEIVDFKRRTNLPLSLVMLIDTSPSQVRTLSNSKMAVRAFIDAVAQPGDRIAVATFTGDTILEQDLTSDLAMVRRAIENVKIPSPEPIPLGGPRVQPDAPGATAIWDAIWVASEEILSATPVETRRAIIMLSDGGDTKIGKKKMSDAIERAIQANVTVYVIGIADLYYYELEKSPLRKVSERTGGQVFFPKKKTDLPAVFAEIEQELRSQYLVTFRPSNRKSDGKFRRVEIEIVNPELRKQKLGLLHAQGYYVGH